VDTASISRDMTVKISQGLIQEIRKTSTSKGDTLEEGWVRIDAGGMYLCPGLIDCEFPRGLRGGEEG
jgi:imidazolonepropionase-like amidohydrolase